ncbi:hypothetical protein LDENG_00033200 [Lucifuga dentata]|nr:hypothetical protein LDENG_00033200 [Lucifuga dentata]
MTKRATLQILPCTVSQLLSASEISTDGFVIGNCEVTQVSILGVIRGFAPFVTNVQYSVDDRTGPAMDGQRSLLASNVRCIQDPNEITSHMLEVVQAHMQLCGKEVDVNMNTTTASKSGSVQSYGKHLGGQSEGMLPYGLSTIQTQVSN